MTAPPQHLLPCFGCLFYLPILGDLAFYKHVQRCLSIGKPWAGHPFEFEYSCMQSRSRARSDSPGAGSLLHHRAMSRDCRFAPLPGTRSVRAFCTQPEFLHVMTRPHRHLLRRCSPSPICRESSCCGTCARTTWSSTLSESQPNLGSGLDGSRYECKMHLARYYRF